jgi:riboflavin synthase
MFTGIIEGTGKITKRDERFIWIEPLFEIESLKRGESFSVDGICLTLLEEKLPLKFELSKETRRKTSLNKKGIGDYVNLERAMEANGRFSGHILLGHVDGVGRISFIGKRGEDMILAIRYPPEISEFIVPMGSIGVDGISLTIQRVHEGESTFECVILPYTYEKTTLPFKKKGDEINLEVDIIARYIKGIYKKEEKARREEKILKYLEER